MENLYEVYYGSLSDGEKKRRAAELYCSPRGMQLVARGLYEAFKNLNAEADPVAREPSDLADIQLMLQSLFPAFLVLYATRDEKIKEYKEKAS